MIFYPTYEATNGNNKNGPRLEVKGFIENTKTGERRSARVVIRYDTSYTNQTRCKCEVWSGSAWEFVTGFTFEQTEYGRRYKKARPNTYGAIVDRDEWNSLHNEVDEVLRRTAQSMLSTTADILWPDTVDNERVNGIGAYDAIFLRDDVVPRP